MQDRSPPAQRNASTSASVIGLESPIIRAGGKRLEALPLPPSCSTDVACSRTGNRCRYSTAGFSRRPSRRAARAPVPAPGWSHRWESSGRRHMRRGRLHRLTSRDPAKDRTPLDASLGRRMTQSPPRPRSKVRKEQRSEVGSIRLLFLPNQISPHNDQRVCPHSIRTPFTVAQLHTACLGSLPAPPWYAARSACAPVQPGPRRRGA